MRASLEDGQHLILARRVYSESLGAHDCSRATYGFRWRRRRPRDQSGSEDRADCRNGRRIAKILGVHASVLIVDTRNLRAITHAKPKNDRIDARRLAQLLAAGSRPACGAAMTTRASAGG
jgi:hypothetical protein